MGGKDAGRDTPRTIAHVDAEREFSGGEVQVFLLMEGLRERGFRNLLVCPPGCAAEREARARGFEVAPVHMRNDLDLPAVVVLARVFSRERVDLVHLHTGRATWLGGLAAALGGRPAITTRRMDRRVRRGLRTRWIYRRLVRRAAAISPAVARALEDGGVPRERVVVIPSSVDPEAVRPTRSREEMRAALDVAPGTSLLLTLASLVPRKGIDVLLAALAEPELAEADLTLCVAGDGPERAALERRAAELTHDVRFLGRRDDGADLLAACDVFVLPSRREGLGVAALEALAAGRPVVASRVGGLAETVRDGETGLVVEPGDAGALATALARLARDPELGGRLGAEGAARVAEQHAPARMVAAYVALYAEVLGRADVSAAPRTARPRS